MHYARDPKSAFVVTYAKLSDSKDFADAVLMAAFFYLTERSAAWAFAEEHSFSRVHALTNPAVSAMFPVRPCKHCDAKVRFDYEHRQWRSHSEPLPQYCYADPVHGSRLHEPK